MDGLVDGVNFVENVELRKKLQTKVDLNFYYLFFIIKFFFKIQIYCKFKIQNFPGSQPVSMECSPEKNNLEYLAQNDYMVSWKADGVR